MKNMKKSLLLTAALFSLVACGAAGGTANSTDSGYTSGSTAAPDGEFDITYVADDVVSIAGPVSAAKDARVSFSISYAEADYVVESVTVNNELPFSEGDNVFSFVMPEEAVTVTVTGHYVDPTHGKYRIENANENYGVILDSASDYAKPGETVSFKVKFYYASPYSFTGVVYVTNDTTLEDIDVVSLDGVYSFVMPESDVSVEVGLEANKYQITIGDSEKSANFASSPFAVETEDDVFANLTGEHFEEYYHGKNYYAYYAKYNDNIRVKVKKSTDNLIVEGVRLSGAFSFSYDITELEPVPEEDYYYCYFTMPAHTVDVAAFGSINYKSIAVENSTHFQATLKVKDGDDYVAITNLDEIVPGTTIYVDISWIGEPDDNFEFDKITVDQVSSVSTDTAGQRYHFTMPNKDGVKVTVFEKNAGPYKNAEFAGVHYGANLYTAGSGKTASMNSSHTLSIDGDGNIDKGGTKYTIGSVSERSSFGVITTSNDKQIAYSGKFIFGHYSFGSNEASAFGTDWHVSVLGQDGDTKDNYKFYYQIDSSKSFIAVQAYRVVSGVETLYAEMLYDHTNVELYSKDVTFNFTSGTYVSDSNATYTIEWNGTVVGKVTNGSTFVNLVPHPQVLTIVNSTHFAATAYNGETAIADLTQVNAGTEVTIKLADVDAGDGKTKGEDYDFDKLSFTDDSEAAVTVSVTTVTAGVEYKFNMPKVNVTMTVNEKDYSAFKGYPFVGSFFGANLYGYNKAASSSMVDSYKLENKADGSVTKGSGYTSSFTITSATANSGDGLATLSSGKNFCYSDKFVFGHYSFSSDLNSKFGTDYIVAIKKQESTDTSNMYMFYYRIDNNKNYIAVQAFRDGVYYASMFFDTVNKEFYGTDLEFEFAEGDSRVDTVSTFTVKVGSTTIGTVTDGTYTKA